MLFKAEVRLTKIEDGEFKANDGKVISYRMAEFHDTEGNFIKCSYKPHVEPKEALKMWELYTGTFELTSRNNQNKLSLIHLESK